MVFRLFFLALVLPLWCFSQPWVMFSDSKDTYLYDQASGMVYIRVKDEFVPMGVKSLNSNNQSKAPTNGLEILQSLLPNQNNETQKNLIMQQAQEMQRNLQNSLYGNDTQTP